MIARLGNVLLSAWVACIYLFLYIPLFVLIVFSFNDAVFPYHWVGFSWRWYSALFSSGALWTAVFNSLVVGVSAVTLSLVIGLLFVMWITSRRSDYYLAVFYPNLVVPEIVLAVGLLSFFIFFQANNLTFQQMLIY